MVHTRTSEKKRNLTQSSLVLMSVVNNVDVPCNASIFNSLRTPVLMQLDFPLQNNNEKS